MNQENKNIFVRHAGIGSLIFAIVGLGILCLVSSLCGDKCSFQWAGEVENFPKFMPAGLFVLIGKIMEVVWRQPGYVQAFVLMGKAWVLVWIVLCWGLLTNNRRRTLIVLMGLLLSLSVIPIKLTTQRLRPRNIVSNKIPVTPAEKFTHSWSFPSGDTTAAFAVAAGLAPFISRRKRIIAFTIAGLIGFSRVAVYAHYMSDAMAGAILGIVCAYLGFRLMAARPQLRKGLLRHLSRPVMIAGIILIPVIHGASGNWDEVKVFAMTYPIAVIIIYSVTTAAFSVKRRQVDKLTG